ncbi:MAG TPA: tetratricopeptide repeat protein [Bacteroidia bacterium]|nr:tetratricopeptide repeat protein [Bacteroidia bacterium]
MKNILLVILLAIGGLSCKAQTPLSTKSKKATKAYNMAMQHMDLRQYDQALAELAKAKKEDPDFVEAYLLQATLHMELRQWAEAEVEFKKSFALNPNFFPPAYYDCAQAEMKQGKYAEAKTDFQTFLDKKRSSTPPRLVEIAENGIASCDFALKAIANPVAFKPVNMGPSTNSAECEYFPNVTADDNMFVFTRNAIVKNPNGVGTRQQEDFYISYKDDQGNWSTAQNMGSPINTTGNEGAPSLSADGRYLYFAACEEIDGYGGGRQGYGSCDIFFTQKVNGLWTAPVNVGAPVNTAAWETQPSFSSDGKTLYYISNRRDGFGNSDIWMCTLDEKENGVNPSTLVRTSIHPEEKKPFSFTPTTRLCISLPTDTLVWADLTSTFAVAIRWATGATR